MEKVEVCLLGLLPAPRQPINQPKEISKMTRLNMIKNHVAALCMTIALACLMFARPAAAQATAPGDPPADQSWKMITPDRKDALLMLRGGQLFLTDPNSGNSP